MISACVGKTELTGDVFMMQVKGSAIASIPKFIENKQGKDGLNRWLNSLSPASKGIYSNMIMANQWYSYADSMDEPVKKMVDMFYRGDPRGAWESGKYSADIGLNGVYKIFVKAGSPEFIMKRAPSIMAGYYNPSQINLIESSAKKCVIQISNFQGITPLIEARLGGWMERALEINGCKNLRVEITKSLTKGSPCSEFVITWN